MHTVIAILAACILATAVGAAEPLWRIGVPDDSAAEFVEWRLLPDEVVEIPKQTPRSVAGGVSRGLKGSANPAFTVRFTLASVPRHGAMLAMKLIDAPKSGAQMGVFVNRRCAGLVQLWGSSGTTAPHPWKRTYRLFVPRELLAKGANELRLTAVHPLWSDASADDRVWWTWDDLSFAALDEPAVEPIHGAVAYLGTTLKHGGGGFRIDDSTVALAPVALRWLGIAHSGNTMRADLWYDVAGEQPRRREYLEALRALNMTVVVDHIAAGHFRLEDGKVPAGIEQDLRAFFDQYGALVQWYELGNEPCMFGGGLAETIALAELVARVKPPQVQSLATAWAYGGGKGEPKDWDADVENRRRIEALSDALNGHSYGYSYAEDRGGSFVETLRSCGPLTDGWPKPFINSETGANSWHSEENGPRLPSREPKAQAFDRIMRAHLAVVDRTMQHAAIFDDFGLFSSLPDADPQPLAAYPAEPNETATRVATFRRLACAYATHGAPLGWTVVDGEATRDRLVYVRAVDTARLEPQVGSLATSDKVLINLVNFEATAQSIRVRVTMPARGRWLGDRIGAGDTWTAARADAAIDAAPTAVFAADLAPGEAVQWILSPPAVDAGRLNPPRR